MSHHEYPQPILDLLKQRVEASERLWIEDDAKPHDRERIDGAFQRWFGIDYNEYQKTNRPILEINYFDEFWTEYEDGKIVSIDCHGHELRKIKP